MIQMNTMSLSTRAYMTNQKAKPAMKVNEEN